MMIGAPAPPRRTARPNPRAPVAPMTVTGSWDMGVMGSFVLTVDRLPPWAVLGADADDPQRRIRGDLGRHGHTAGTVVATRLRPPATRPTRCAPIRWSRFGTGHALKPDVPLRDSTTLVSEVTAPNSSSIRTTATTSCTEIMVSAGMVSAVQADMSVATYAGAIAVAMTPLADSSAFSV